MESATRCFNLWNRPYLTVDLTEYFLGESKFHEIFGTKIVKVKFRCQRCCTLKSFHGNIIVHFQLGNVMGIRNTPTSIRNVLLALSPDPSCQYEYRASIVTIRAK